MSASSLARGQSLSRVVVRLLNERSTATGATLTDLSRTTGIPAATLRRQLAGHTDLGVATLHFLAVALGTTGADLCRTAQTEVDGGALAAPWWDTEDHDAVSESTWRTRDIHVVGARPGIRVTAETDHTGHTYVTATVPRMENLEEHELRRLRVAIDRAIRTVQRADTPATKETMR